MSLRWGHVVEPSGPGPRTGRGGCPVAARRDRHDPVSAEGQRRSSPRRWRRRPVGRPSLRACPTSTAPTSPWSPSTPRARWTSTRPSTSRARAPATSSTTRSPMWRRSCGPATRSTSPPTSGARRSTAPTPRCRSTRPSSRRARPRCCPTRCARLCSGPSTSTTPARAPTCRWSGHGCGRPRSSTTPRCSGRSTRARPTRPSGACARWASSGWLVRPPAVASHCRCPSRRWTSPATSGRWSSAR